MKILLIFMLSISSIYVYADSSSAPKIELSTSYNSLSTYDDDPLEEFNREMFAFNTFLYANIVHPISSVYKEYSPVIIQQSVHNFFSNLGDVPTLGNQLLQLKLTDSLNTIMRIIFNTTFGMAGIVDVATGMGFKKSSEDFGQTLGHYGASSGPYFVLPVLGSSSLRDVTRYYADGKMGINLKQDTNEAIATTVTQGISTSARLIDIVKAAYQNEDPYTKIRSSYLQNREFQINDGDINAKNLDF